MKHSFEVYLKDEMVFFSDRHWLYPLFEFEKFLKQKKYPIAQLFVKDKIIGRAAALILVYLGIKTVHGQTMSQLACEVFEYYKVNYSFDKQIKQIACQTEMLLKTEWSGARAYQVIKDRIEKHTK